MGASSGYINNRSFVLSFLAQQINGLLRIRKHPFRRELLGNLFRVLPPELFGSDHLRPDIKQDPPATF